MTIPEYMQQFMGIDISTVHSIACPFHNEQHGKSFTYSPEKDIFRCWGSCHTGGDVYNLHKLHYRLKSRAEAVKSLNKILGLQNVQSAPSFNPITPKVNEESIEFQVLYAQACQRAKTVDDYLKLDYILSKIPCDLSELELYVRS